MSTFTAIQDMSNMSLILDSLREVGHYFHQVCHASMSSEGQTTPEALSLSGLSLSDGVYKSVEDVFLPLANYLQNKAEDSQKEKLGEMLAADSKIIDYLCEGILNPFVKETSLQGSRDITHSHALYVVLLLQVCLMECSENLRLRQELIECGCIYLLLKELRNMTRSIQTNTDSNKHSRQLIQTAALTVGNCLSDNVDLYMRLHPGTDINGAFTSYVDYPDSIVRLVCQLTYHQFSYYLHQSNPGSTYCPATISGYTQLLHTASESKQFVARLDKLFIDATDLMKVLQCLCISAKNRQSLVESSEFHKAISNLLLGEGEREIKCALNLLLTYLTEGQPIAAEMGLAKRKGKKEQSPKEDRREQTRSQLLSHFPEILFQLESVLASRHGDLKKLCSSVLWCIRADPENDIHSCLLYVECCYEYRHFGECCYWSDYIGQQCSANVEAKRLRDRFLLYKAKAKYHIYQRQHVVLRRSEQLQNLGEMKQDRERVYEDTKEVISILGSLKAKNFSLDLESEQFLDYALMDYIRELNKRSSKDSLYCMLCHQKKPIVRSHAVPEALLKIIFRKGQNIFMMGPASVSLDSHVKTLHTVTFNMLCNICDNEVLSRDENLFIEHIVKPVYQTSISHLERVDKISYGKWLYRFCAGIIFRNLALCRGVTGSRNADEVHKLFHYCRSVVNPSPQADAMAENPAQIACPEVEKNLKLPTSENKFSIAIFFTPGMLEDLDEKEKPPGMLEDLDEKEKPSNLVRALNSSLLNCLSNIPISGTSSNLAQKCYFFAVHFGIFTIVAFLEPVPTKYHHFLVDPHNGEFSIPANSDRLSLIPPGLLKIFEKRSEKTVKQYFERLVEVNQDMKSVSLTVLKSNVTGGTIGQPTSFSLLPPKYELNRQTNVMTMKEGHSILLHHTLQMPSASHTVILAVEEVAPTRPYVIIHSYWDAPAMSQTFGYFISFPEFAFKDELDASHRVFMQQIRAKDLDLFKLPPKVIPAKLECAGLQSYQSILYHLNRNPVFDKKCIPDGCWYCCRKCDVCMLDSAAGLIFSTQSEGDPEAKFTLRFHDEKCKAFSYRSREFPSSFSLKEPLKEVTFHLLSNHNDGKLSGEVTSMHLLSIAFSSYDERNQCPTRIAVDIYRVKEGNDELPSGRYIALFDVRTYDGQTFGEYFLTDELQLEKPLPHVRVMVDKELIQLLNDVIHEVILKSGRKYIHSLCTQVANQEPLLVHETSPEDNECDELIGLDFS